MALVYHNCFTGAYSQLALSTKFQTSTSNQPNHAHLPWPCCRNGSCLSSVLNASVRGVYGVAGVALATDFISHCLSSLSEVGEPFVTCMSSYSIFEAALWAAVGMSDQIPKSMLRMNIVLWTISWNFYLTAVRTYAMTTVTAKVPFAIWQYFTCPDSFAKSQLLVIYHAELDGYRGSERSGPDWP